MNALLIGCGNIGARYDMDEPGKIWSHAKAYSLNEAIELYVYDEDHSKSRDVSSRYKVKVLDRLENVDKGKFDIVSITTPTSTHFSYLKNMLAVPVPVIICEKPVVGSLDELKQLRDLYAASGSRVLVNYMRRFQPGYKLAKERLSKIPPDTFRGINIKYKRGFLNNAGHAIDLIEFLTGQPFRFENFKTSDARFDAFPNDPTLTGSCNFMGQPVSITGLCDVDYPVFEIEFFYRQGKVVICHSGNEIRYYSSSEGKGLVEVREDRQENILDNYMQPVIGEAIDLLQKTKSADNFVSSLRINEEILKIIEPIKD